ncbi:MAG: helix-turn-helix domain-containing protein [bacterium]|nr:helix-turn-helix domain-containing protein [bacterium]
MSEFFIDILNEQYGHASGQAVGVASPISVPRPMIERELVRLGLSPKGAQVYLAALELGPAPVQEIAKLAGVNRATTYVVIEELIAKGLTSSIERGSKRLFIAEPPERLKQLLRHEEDKIKDARDTLGRILPELSLLLQSAPERPRVRFYEGLEGLEAMRADFFSSADGKQHELLMISSADDYHAVVGMARRLPHAKRIERTRGFERCIFTSARSKEELLKSLPLVDHIERYKIPESEFPLAGEVTVHGSKIAMLSYRGSIMGVLIESPYLSQTITTLFNLAWKTAKSFEKIEA